MLSETLPIRAVLSTDVVSHLRRKYKHNSVGIAKGVVMFLNEHGLSAEYITFRNGDSLFKDKVTYWSQSAHAWKRHRNHSIVLVGNQVIDILSADITMDAEDYIRLLQEKNSNLKVVTLLSGTYDKCGNAKIFSGSPLLDSYNIMSE